MSVIGITAKHHFCHLLSALWDDNDFNKSFGSGLTTSDDAMCWAASAANVIAWWQDQNEVKGKERIPLKDDVWKTYVAVFDNVGGNPDKALEWWINGKSPASTPTGGYGKESWTGIDGMEYYPASLTGGAFLTSSAYTDKPLYDLTANSLTIAYDSKDVYAYSESIVKAISSGYALTLTVREGADHAFSLWGVEYSVDEQDRYLLTQIWVTDSNDIKTDGTEHLASYAISNEGDALKFQYAGGYGDFRMAQVDGLRCEIVPEPTTASLSLLALAGLAARRRRK